MELVNTSGLGPGARAVQVQVLLPVFNKKIIDAPKCEKQVADIT